MVVEAQAHWHRYSMTTKGEMQKAHRNRNSHSHRHRHTFTATEQEKATAEQNGCVDDLLLTDGFL